MLGALVAAALVFAPADAHLARETANGLVARYTPRDGGTEEGRWAAVFIRALDLIDFDYGSAPGLNDWWHTEKDTMDKVSEKSLLTAGRLCLAVLGQFRNE